MREARAVARAEAESETGAEAEGEAEARAENKSGSRSRNRRVEAINTWMEEWCEALSFVSNFFAALREFQRSCF